MKRLVVRARSIGNSHAGRRLIATSFWSAASESLSRGLLLIAMVLVARVLGKEAYGEFGMIRSTINVFVTLGGMGLGLTANRYVAEFRDTRKRYSGQIIGSSFVIAAVSGLVVGCSVLFGAPTIATRMLHAPQLIPDLRIAALLLALGAINGAQIGILQGLEAYRLLALNSLVQGLSALAALVVGASLFQLRGAVLGLLVYTVVGAVGMQWFIRRETRRQRITIDYSDLRATLPLFWTFSLPVMLAGVAIAPLKWLAEMLLVRRVGFAELGIFTAAMTIAMMLTAIVSTLNAPLISLTANVSAPGNTSRLQYLSLYGSWYAFLAIAIPLMIFPRLTGAMFGRSYASPHFYTVNALLVAYVAMTMYYQGIIRLIALNGSMWFGFATNLCEGAALFIGFYLFSSQGAVGLAMAYVASYVVRIAVSVPYLLKGHVVPRHLVLDKYFVVSAILLGVAIAARVGALT